MKNRNAIAVIGCTLLIMVAACSTMDLSGSAGKAILSDMGKNISNATNFTSNSTNASNSSNTSTGKLSELWSWGSLPAGYTMTNNQIVPGSSDNPDNESIMETPSQLVPDNNPENSPGGMLVRPR